MIITVKVEIPDRADCGGLGWICGYYERIPAGDYCNLFNKDLPNDKPCMECANARDKHSVQFVDSEKHILGGD